MAFHHRIGPDWARMISDLRREAGLSTRGLAARAGLDRSSVRRIETGQSVGTLPVIERLLAALGYEIDVLPIRTPAAHTNPVTIAKDFGHALH